MIPLEVNENCAVRVFYGRLRILKLGYDNVQRVKETTNHQSGRPCGTSTNGLKFINLEILSGYSPGPSIW